MHLSPYGHKELARLVRPSLDILLSDDMPTQREAPPGMANPGDQCYAIAPMQAIAHVPAIRRTVTEHASIRGVKGRFEALLSELWKPCREALGSPVYDIAIGKELGMPRGQNDAEEFFNRAVKTYGPDIGGFGSLFGGIFRQRATCAKCEKCAETDQDGATLCAPLLSLGSDIRPTIDQSLEMNYPESCVIRKICEFGHSDGDTRECDHVQTREWVSLPDVLVVHVLRFDQDGRKILPNGADMEAPPFLQVGGRRYDLCSAVDHLGDSSRSGHYIAHVRCADTNS